MQARSALILFLASVSLCAGAAQTYPLRPSELLQSQRAQGYLDPAVKLHWGEGKPPGTLHEVARSDVNTGISLSGKLFSAGTQEHCAAAFENALDAMVRSARSAGYDIVFDIRAGQGKTPSKESDLFVCTPGYRTTDVRLWSTFAMTPAAAQRFAAAERQSANQPAREPAKGAVFLPLAPVIASPEVKKLLGRHVRAYWGLEAPDYDERTHSAEAYTEYVELAGLTPEEACRQAALKTLGAMVKEARQQDFDSLVRIRSYHNEQFTPAVGDMECALDKKWASVTLRAFMANRR